ncbi:MAG: polysaccharide biosynthesis C-terminal domain-containing protein [Bacteroidales bacterium]|nr:polysaccharide biosynthesis C-terminal domain-containing protein [Bacteroidales bacterium]
MKKKFFTNLIFLVTLNLIVKPFWVLGIDRVVQNNVGSSDYGIYFSLFNLSILFNIILDFGLTNFNNRNIAQHKQLLPKYFSNIVVLKFLLSVFYAIITIALGILWGYNFAEFKILLLLIFNQFLLSFIMYLRSNISGLHFFKTDSLISVLDRFLMIGIIGFLLWSKQIEKNFKIEWFVIAQTIAYSVTALSAFIIVLKHAKVFKIKVNKPFLISTLKHTLPYALLVLLMSFYNRFDAVLIVKLIPDGKIQSGIYAQSFRLLDAVSQFSLLFATLLLPIFSKMIKNKENVSDLVNFSFFLLIAPAIIFAVSSVYYNEEIISLLYKDHTDISARVFSVLITAFIPISTTYIFGTLLTANGSLKQLNIIAFSGVVANLTLNLILIPISQARGAAISALITQSFTAILQIGLAIHMFKIKFSLKKILSIVIFLIVFIGSVHFIHIIDVKWSLRFLASLISGVILAFLLRLMSIKTIFNLLKGYEK